MGKFTKKLKLEFSLRAVFLENFLLVSFLEVTYRLVIHIEIPLMTNLTYS